MEMRRLEVFCKVVELKSFTKAAEALSLSQPTVSEHVRTLEEMLGEKMVDRLGRTVRPTAAGRLFYQYARNILRISEEAMQALMQFKGQLAGRLVLGASTIPGTYILPRLIGLFKAEHPPIQITLKIGDSAEVAEDVLQCNVEAALIGTRLNDRRLLLEEIFSDELVLVVFPDHPWAKKSEIDIEELEGQPFILRERGSGTRRVMERILEEHGFAVSSLAAVAEMGSTEAVRQSVKAGIGVSMISRQAVDEDVRQGRLSEVIIKDIRFFRPFYLIQRKNRQRSPLCNAFLGYLRNAEQVRG